MNKYRIIFKDNSKSCWFSILPVQTTIKRLSIYLPSWYSKQRKYLFKTIEWKQMIP